MELGGGWVGDVWMCNFIPFARVVTQVWRVDSWEGVGLRKGGMWIVDQRRGDECTSERRACERELRKRGVRSRFLFFLFFLFFPSSSSSSSSISSSSSLPPSMPSSK